MNYLLFSYFVIVTVECLVKEKISVFIICMNEERIIEKCLSQATKIADEIILVDSGSTDSTLEIAKNYTDKVFHQDWLGYVDRLLKGLK